MERYYEFEVDVKYAVEESKVFLEKGLTCGYRFTIIPITYL